MIKKMSLANIQGKMSRAEMKNIMAGSPGDAWKCTMTFTDGHTSVMTFPNTGTASGKTAQCMSDYSCRQNDSCKTVDCAGSPAC